MTTLMRKAIAGYNFVFDELADSRTKEWFLVAKPYQGVTILVIYLLFVFKWGPKFMKNRQPYNLERIMIIFNAIQIICCGHIFIYGVSIWITKYKLICQPVNTSQSEDAIAEANLVYFYYFLKIFDLFDTIFFVLRKKFNQVSFLHVYHHTGMVMLIWGATTYVPGKCYGLLEQDTEIFANGGHGTVIGLINSFVHVVMYSYYLMSVAVPKIKEAIWIKKLVTQIQIIQFFLCVVHMGSIVFIPDCAYPRWVAAVFLPQDIFMLILFVDFYIKTYIKKPKQPIPVRKSEKESHEIEDKDVFVSNEINRSIQQIFDTTQKADTELILRNIKRC